MDYELMMNGNVRIGMKAPDFDAQTTMGNISLSNYLGKWVILFSHPGDFTPVCTTEMIAFANANTYFTQMNACLLGLSVDSNPSHLAWAYDIYLRTGIKIPFPIIADRNGQIARKYGMISSDISNTETVRNVYIIDPEGIIRLILIYPLNIGRYIPEILRALEALQVSAKCKGATPANWTMGNPIIVQNPQTFAELEQRSEEVKNNQNGMSWYLSFKSTENCLGDNKNQKEVKKLEDKDKITNQKVKR